MKFKTLSSILAAIALSTTLALGGSFGSSSSFSSARSSSFSSSSSSFSRPSSSFGSTSSFSKPSTSSFGSGSSFSKPTTTTSSFGSSSSFSKPFTTVTTPSTTVTAPATKSSFLSSSKPSNDSLLSRNTAVNTSKYSSRADAINNYKAREASKFNYTFTSEPRTRPYYIPTSYNNHAVYYDYSHGGYGYWDGLTWVTYNALRDAAMINALANSNPEYTVVQTPVATTTVVHHYSSGAIVFEIFCALGVIVIVVGAVAVLGGRS